LSLCSSSSCHTAAVVTQLLLLHRSTVLVFNTAFEADEKKCALLYTTRAYLDYGSSRSADANSGPLVRKACSDSGFRCDRFGFKFQYINLHQEKNGSEIHPGFQGLSFRLRIKSWGLGSKFTPIAPESV